MEPDALIEVAALCEAKLQAHLDHDWSVKAGELDWSCRVTLEHVCSLGYPSVLATRSSSFRPVALAVNTDADIGELLWTMRAGAHVLAEIARAAPPTARAFHPAGMADASGFVAMEGDELLVHTHDIAAGLGTGFRPPDHLTLAVLDRLFPWWPKDAEPWPALLWANGRGSLRGHEDRGAEWLWHCAPLDEWDGTVPTWDPVTGLPAPKE